VELQAIIDKHAQVFQEPPLSLFPSCDHDHKTALIPWIIPLNTNPYHFPYQQKSEIEHLVQELLDVGFIQPGCTTFSATIVLV